MSDEPELKVVQVPWYDTGLGREAGYRDDAELIAAAQKQRALLAPELRERLEAAEREWERQVIFGDGL